MSASRRRSRISGWVGATLLAVDPVAAAAGCASTATAAAAFRASLLATLVMAIAILLAQHGLPALFGVATFGLARVILLAVLVAIGLAVYLATIQTLGVARLRDIMAAIGQRGVDGP